MKIEQREVLAATTDAANSDTFSVYADRPWTVIVDGLAGVEVAALEQTVDNEASWIAMSDSSGAIELTATTNSILVEGPGVYRIAKDATVGAVAVYAVG